MVDAFLPLGPWAMLFATLQPNLSGWWLAEALNPAQSSGDSFESVFPQRGGVADVADTAVSSR